MLLPSVTVFHAHIYCVTISLSLSLSYFIYTIYCVSISLSCKYLSFSFLCFRSLHFRLEAAILFLAEAGYPERTWGPLNTALRIHVDALLIQSAEPQAYATYPP